MDWIAETFRGDGGWEHLQALVDVGDRMAGSEGERRGLELTRDALVAAGARDTRIEPFEIQGWSRGGSRIGAGETDQSCIALPRSPSGEVSGRFVDLGHGLPADFEDADLDGAVVMAASDVPDWYDRFLHRREKYYHAVERGAAAFVFRNHVEGCLPPTGSVGTDEDPIGSIPAVGVSKEVGARLARRFAGETVTVEVDAETGPAESGIVRAALGPDTDERVLLTSHVDAHDIAEGAMDNGAGTATVVEVAAALDRRGDLDTRVEVACFGAEEVGLRGSEFLAERTDRSTIRAVINLDGVVRGRTLRVSIHHADALAEAVESVADRLDHPITVDPTLNPHSDHWPFVARGVPGAMVMSETDGPGRGWGHTHADTLDKLEPRTLRESAVLLTELVATVAAEGWSCPRIGEDDLAAALETEGYATGMRRTGDWPFYSND